MKKQIALLLFSLFLVLFASCVAGRSNEGAERMKPFQITMHRYRQTYGINHNPWGYDFTPGTPIYHPPATFCTYFPCAPSFFQNNGYVVLCNDGKYSLSGGTYTACLYDDGVKQLLYAHPMKEAQS